MTWWKFLTLDELGKPWFNEQLATRHLGQDLKITQFLLAYFGLMEIIMLRSIKIVTAICHFPSLHQLLAILQISF